MRSHGEYRGRTTTLYGEGCLGGTRAMPAFGPGVQRRERGWVPQCRRSRGVCGANLVAAVRERRSPDRGRVARVVSTVASVVSFSGCQVADVTQQVENLKT